MKSWPVQDAKARFSEFLQASLKHGPQMVTLRGARMYAFLDKYLNIAIPRTKDFRGFSVKSIDAMRKGMAEKDVSLRIEVIHAIEYYRDLKRRKRPMTPAIEAAIEQLLLEAFNDKSQEENTGRYSQVDGKLQQIELRVCDAAARELSQRWERPELFDPAEATEIRDRQIEELKALAKSKKK